MSTETVTVEYGFAPPLKPVEWKLWFQREGLGSWWWIRQSQYSRAFNGPFWTLKGAKEDAARYGL